MNKQRKSATQRGIEWTDYTWNPVGGCKHACRWTMPDGNVARCYAEDVANGVARSAYKQGFEHHYWHPARLDEPLKLAQPARIFVDSMSDLLGAWVPDDQVRAVIDVMRRASQHHFQILTKAPKRLLKFDWPDNAWLGVSMPPDTMMGQVLTDDQKDRFMGSTERVLFDLHVGRGNVTFMSFEPLSWDVSDLFHAPALSWAIIGAASRGNAYYQPDPAHLSGLLAALNREYVPVFFKGNLRSSVPNDADWREEFPVELPRSDVAEQRTLL